MQCPSWKGRAMAQHHPAGSTPTTISSVPPNPSEGALPPPCPPFSQLQKHCFTNYPWAGAALLWTTLTFICYLEPFGHQGRHLTYFLTAWGSTFLIFPSFFRYCCFVWHTALREENFSLARALVP